MPEPAGANAAAHRQANLKIVFIMGLECLRDSREIAHAAPGSRIPS